MVLLIAVVWGIWANGGSEHDTLFREVKRATGKELDDLPIQRAKPTAVSTGRHSGPCLRNSSCGCPQCAGGASGGTPTGASRPDPPIRRREMRSTPADDPYACQSNTSRSHTGSAHEIEVGAVPSQLRYSSGKGEMEPRC